MPVWTLTLEMPRAPGRPRLELAAIAVEVRSQLRDGRVLGPDLADLATDADRHAVRLERPDQRGQLGRAAVVLALLLVDVRLRQVDQRRRVDVDVAIAGVDRQPAGAPDLLGHRLRVGGVLLGVELVVVALDEDRALPARRDRAGEHRRRVVDRALERVGLLAPGELEDDRADVGRLGRLVDRPGHVEGLRPEVDGRDGEARDLARARASYSAWMLADRAPSSWLASQTSHWAARGRRLVVAERGGPGEVTDARVAEGGLVIDDQPVAVEVGAPARGASRSVGEVATWGIGVVSPDGVSTAMVPPLPRTPQPIDRDQRPGLTTIRKTMTTIMVPRNIPPRWIFLTVATISGGGGPGGVPGGGGVEDSSMR